MTREELLAAMELERFGPLPPRPTHRRTAQSTTKSQALSTDDPQAPNGSVEKVTRTGRPRRHRWSAKQIADALSLPQEAVVRVMEQRETREVA